MRGKPVPLRRLKPTAEERSSDWYRQSMRYIRRRASVDGDDEHNTDYYDSVDDEYEDNDDGDGDDGDDNEPPQHDHNVPPQHEEP